MRFPRGVGSALRRTAAQDGHGPCPPACPFRMVARPARAGGAITPAIRIERIRMEVSKPSPLCSSFDRAATCCRGPGPVQIGIPDVLPDLGLFDGGQARLSLNAAGQQAAQGAMIRVIGKSPTRAGAVQLIAVAAGASHRKLDARPRRAGATRTSVGFGTPGLPPVQDRADLCAGVVMLLPIALLIAWTCAVSSKNHPKAHTGWRRSARPGSARRAVGKGGRSDGGRAMAKRANFSWS